MPEIAEVRTVAKTLNERIVGKKIKKVETIYSRIVEGNLEDFKKNLEGLIIHSVDNYGKWMFFNLGEYTILSHLRMEGKYFIKEANEPIEKHEHLLIHFEDNTDLRYHDTRKFGRLKLVKTEEIYKCESIKKLGIEPDNKALTSNYIYESVHRSNKPIKTLLLDQTIINGLGNIYADEVLFASGIHPETLGCKINLKDADKIKTACASIIKKATELGGTTIRSYTSSLGVYGNYQEYLCVHTKTTCPNCQGQIEKIRVGGRGTYFCSKCQKRK